MRKGMITEQEFGKFLSGEEPDEELEDEEMEMVDDD